MKTKALHLCTILLCLCFRLVIGDVKHPPVSAQKSVEGASAGAPVTPSPRAGNKDGKRDAELDKGRLEKAKASRALPTPPALPPGVRPMTDRSNSTDPIPCTCGVFLTSQCKSGGPVPAGLPAISHEFSRPTANTSFGNRQCTSACVDMIVKHLPNSAAILCSTIQRDVWKEKAYLFIKNHRDKWISTGLAAGRVFCCKNGVPIKCNPF